MLVLSRKPGERILIGPDITITVVRLGPYSVRLGIDAPQHLNIVRQELELRWGLTAAASAPSDSTQPLEGVTSVKR